MTNYTPDILRNTNISTLARLVKLTKTRVEKAFEDGDMSLTKDEVANIVKEGVPIEPFLLGIDTWENLTSKLTQEISESEEFLSLLVDDAKKKFPYPLNKLAYTKFLEYRRDVLRKPVSNAGATRQKNILRGYDIEVQQEIITESISSKWESIFKPKQFKLTIFEKNIERRKQKVVEQSHIQVSESGETKEAESLSVIEMMNLFEGK